MNEKLRQARYDRSWSIERAASQIGVSRTTYIRWEQGTQFPHGSTLQDACKAFRMSAEQLGFEKNVMTLPASDLFSLPDQHLIGNSEHTSEDMFSIGVMALILAQKEHGWTLNELGMRTAQEMKRLDMENKQSGILASRRQALKFLIGLPLVTIGLTQVDSASASPLNVEETLPLYVTSIPACWKLYYSGPNEWREIDSILPAYITHLTSIAQQASKYQKMAASLLSQAHQLGAEIALVKEDFTGSVNSCKNAFLFAELANDANLKVASLIREANTLFYRHRSTAHLNQQALKYINDVSPLMRGRVYSELSTSYAAMGDEKEALKYIDMAHECTPEQPEEDPSYAYTHSNQYILHFNDMYVHLEHNKPDKAWASITAASQFVPEAVTARRMELLKHLVMVAISLGDLELCTNQFEQLAAAAKEMGSDLHLSEAFATQRQILAQWPYEQRARNLVNLLEA